MSSPAAGFVLTQERCDALDATLVAVHNALAPGGRYSVATVANTARAMHHELFVGMSDDAMCRVIAHFFNENIARLTAQNGESPVFVVHPAPREVQ